MSDLKTLKDFGMVDINCGEYEDDTIVTKIDLKKEAIKWVKSIQSGSGVNRNKFPDTMKGSYPKTHWDNSDFTLGIEYGFIIGLMEFFNLTEEDLI